VGVWVTSDISRLKRPGLGERMGPLGRGKRKRGKGGKREKWKGKGGGPPSPLSEPSGSVSAGKFIAHAMIKLQYKELQTIQVKHT